MPDQIDLQLQRARAALKEGRLRDAERIAGECLEARPLDLHALLLLGVSAAQQGKAEVAAPALIRLTELDPNSVAAFSWLSVLLRGAGRIPEALAMAERTVALKPQDPNALCQLGVCFLDLGQLERAEETLRAAVKAGPHLGPPHANLAAALEKLGRHADAAREYRRAVSLQPRDADLLHSLGQCLIQLLEFREGFTYAKRLLELEPNSDRAHSLMAITLIGVDQPHEAAKHLMRCIELAPNSANVLAFVGSMLQSIGRLDEAEVHLRKSLELEPRQGYTYYALVRAATVTDMDLSLIARMSATASNPDLSVELRSDVQYALGKAQADLGDYGASMAHYNEANRMTRQMRFGDRRFNRNVHAEDVDFIIENLNGGFFRKFGEFGSPEELPLFIVGMIRSGTTLAEQILSCHPDVAAGGELSFWPNHRKETKPMVAGDPARSGLQDIEQKYLALLREIGPGKPRVTDKMPANYGFLGLLYAAFPKARAIHMRRNAVDTCLSIWTTPNRTPSVWANGKEDLVFTYRQYLRVMAHWRAVLPPDWLLEIDYEDLVIKPEETIRRMLEFCGLPWDDACLHHERNTRAVTTPSAWQVRQPVYRGAVERWRPYEPWLDEFRELLTP